MQPSNAMKSCHRQSLGDAKYHSHSGSASPVIRQNKYDQDDAGKPGDCSVMQLHVCGLS